MPPIKKILFPVDFSPASAGTGRYVEAIAGHFEAEIILVHVVGMGEHNLAEELLPSRQAQLDAFLADELKYFTTRRLCVMGDDAAIEIEKIATGRNVDLVMVPTHGLGAFRRFLIGSVTAKVLNDLDCPVWTSVHAEMAPPLEKIHCRRVLCALDLSDRSQAVFQWATWLASEYDAELDIVHATPDLTAPFYGSSMEEEYTQTALEQARRRIEMMQTATGGNGRIIVSPGDPAKVVSAAAADTGADLLVIGRHSAEGIVGRLRQDAYAILRDSPCPVISI